MTSLEITILLHCHTRNDEIPYRDLPAVKQVVQALLVDELIKADGDRCGFCCTEKGKAHVRQLCNVPLPVSQWVDVAGNQIK